MVRHLKAGKCLNIVNWSFFVLFRCRFVSRIMMRWEGRELLLSFAKVSNTKDLLNIKTCQGMLCASTQLPHTPYHPIPFKRPQSQRTRYWLDLVKPKREKRASGRAPPVGAAGPPPAGPPHQPRGARVVASPGQVSASPKQCTVRVQCSTAI